MIYVVTAAAQALVVVFLALWGRHLIGKQRRYDIQRRLELVTTLQGRLRAKEQRIDQLIGALAEAVGKPDPLRPIATEADAEPLRRRSPWVPTSRQLMWGGSAQVTPKALEKLPDGVANPTA